MGNLVVLHFSGLMKNCFKVRVTHLQHKQSKCSNANAKLSFEDVYTKREYGAGLGKKLHEFSVESVDDTINDFQETYFNKIDLHISRQFLSDPTYVFLLEKSTFASTGTVDENAEARFNNIVNGLQNLKGIHSENMGVPIGERCFFVCESSCNSSVQRECQHKSSMCAQCSNGLRLEKCDTSNSYCIDHITNKLCNSVNYAYNIIN